VIREDSRMKKKNKGGGKTKLRKEDKMGEELLIGNFEREEK